MKKLIAAILSILMLLPLAACGGIPNDTKTDIKPIAEILYPTPIDFDDRDGKEKLHTDNPISEEFYTSITEFSYKTASTVLSTASGNSNYSPLSLYFALALASTGANGQTQAEMLSLLGNPSADELSSQCGNLYRILYADNEISQLKIATSLWAGKDTTLTDSFVQGAAKNFYSPIFNVSFTDDATGKAMGKWVSDNTKGTISPEFYFETEHILSILNTVYFYDEWIDRFDKNKTAPDTFFAKDGEVTTDFMHRTYGSSGFAKGDGFTRSTLKLKDSGSMIFILPDEGVSTSDLLQSPKRTQEIFEGGEGSMGEVVWQIPKFSYSSKQSLVDTLKTLGVTSAFEENADFSNMTSGTAFISDINQETHIAIDENGVEAAAFTEIGYAGAALPRGRADMVLTRPFIYGITAKDGTMLFMGVCENPTK